MNISQPRNDELLKVPRPSAPAVKSPGTAFGQPRDFHECRFVYTVISPRARGLSVGVNMNPDKRCNFDCIYCEVNRDDSIQRAEPTLDIPAMIAELDRTLTLVLSGKLHAQPRYSGVPRELLELRHVTLSGDGEPTLCPNFKEAVEAIVHLRARGRWPFFKLVLLTNAAGLDRPEVIEGLRLLTNRDEIWAKLDAGTQAYMSKVNRCEISLDNILANILSIARHRPVVIQSLFSSIAGVPPAPSEIEAYVERLLQLKQADAQISLVQIYSATRPAAQAQSALHSVHLPLRTLSAIARRVREATGLKAEVF